MADVEVIEEVVEETETVEIKETETPETKTAETQTAETNWRDSLKSEDAKKFAESSTDIESLVNRALEMRTKLSNAITKPDRRKPEDVAAWRKAIGVPERPEDYQFVVPEGHELTDDDKIFQTETAKMFHNLEINAAQAQGLNTFWNTLQTEQQNALIAQDERFAKDKEAELRTLWPGDEYEVNHEHANRAAMRIFGADLEDVRHMTTKDDKIFLDHPVMVKALATIGREMQEAGIVPKLNANDAAAVDEQIAELRKKSADANAAGNSRLANEYYRQEQDLIARAKGNQNIVGGGRAA